MNARTVTLLVVLLPLCLDLLPAAVAAQGSVGPMQELSLANAIVAQTARVGSLAFLDTYALGTYPPFMPGFIRSDGTPQGTFSIDPRGAPPYLVIN